MPFTISHAVLAVPLAKLTQNRIPIAAIAIGCMTPDLARLFTRHEVIISHQWNGMIVPNLILGMFFCLLWYLLYRPALFAWLNINDPLNLKNLNSCCGFILVSLLGILIGCATHLIWDGLTHLDYRTFAFHQTLAQPIAVWNYSFELHEILQIACSVMAMPFIFWMMLHYYRHHYDPVFKQKKTKIFFIVLTLSSLAGLYKSFDFLTHHSKFSFTQHPYYFIGESLNAFTTGFLIFFTLCCLSARVIQHIQNRHNNA